MDIDKIPPLTHVKVKVNGTEFKGKLLPKEGESYVLKLDSGYNVGIFPKNIESVEELEEEQTLQEQQNSDSIIQNEDLPKIKILHTGGTIASKVDYKTGGVIADFTPEALIGMFPELTEIANIESQFMGNMWSDDFRFAHFNQLASAVLDGVNSGINKFIVTSGTDFLHYLSSALSFVLKDVPASVAVVGAQRSSDRGSSDAGMNLIGAAVYLSKTNFQGVVTCMHASVEDTTCNIIHGTHARKMHSTRRDAFQSINTPIIATVDYEKRTVKQIEIMNEIKSEIPSRLPLFKEDLKVGLLYSKPNLYAQEILAYQNFDGLILAGSGLGHFPISKPNDDCSEHEKIKSAISELAKSIPVAMSVQTINGRVHMNVYSPGRELQEMGVIGHGSVMTPETSYIKLSWLLSNYSKEEVKEFYTKDVVGELNSNEPNKLL
ncbi:Glu-tRNA(Gln) amidotransferase subunit GatD [Candidatus Woesearchaeota archaeon]|nr:Glu-tRNA(Gln) amidotransferase subunit GatD [Candidatus Woesearchaeota archaeon]